MAPASPFNIFLHIIITITLLSHHTRIIDVAATPPPTPTSLNASGSLQCVDSPDWTTASFLAYDCYTAIALFEDYEVYRHGATVYEFLSSTLTPTYPSFAMTTPRKYSYKSCTMTIAMIADVVAATTATAAGGEMPGLPPVTAWAQTDLGDYVGIERGVLNVRDGCLSFVFGGGGGGEVKGKKEEEEGEGEGGKEGGRGTNFLNLVGYDIAGLNGAIGIFLWDTDSLMNWIVVEKVGGGVGNVTTARIGGVDGAVR